MVTDHYSGPLSTLDFEMIRAVPPGGNWRDIPPSVASKRLEQIRNGASVGAGSRSTYYGRLQWEKPAYTISTYFNRPGNGCYIHPSESRLISIREAARLQSFPDDYRFYGSVRDRQVQVGNAVPPLLSYQLARILPPGNYIDLFCGAGGLSLGFEWAGFACVAALDNDSSAIETFSSNRQLNSTINADLGNDAECRNALSGVRDRLNGARPDLIIGGPPCQGFSTAGCNVRDDPRNGLVWAFLRFVDELSPSTVLMENVPALAWKRSRSTLLEIQHRLEALGYNLSLIVAHTEGYGVPQLRRRLFLLARRKHDAARWPVPPFRILDPAYRAYQPGAKSGSCAPFTVRDAIADLPAKTESSPDKVTNYACEPRSAYQRWARKQISLTELLPQVSSVSLPISLPMALGNSCSDTP